MKCPILRSIQIALVLALSLLPAAFSGEDATGSWKWSFTTQNGDTIESSAKLKQDGPKLTGVVTGRFGEAEIMDGSVKNDEITFNLTRERDGVSFVIKYSGKIAGDKIAGKMEFERDGQTRGREWEAKRVKSAVSSATGTWNTALILGDGNRIEGVVKLKQDGEKLSGAISRNNNETEIKEGKAAGDEISFLTLREREGRTVTSKYKAKITGDSLKGKIESDWSGDWQTFDWEGSRAK